MAEIKYQRLTRSRVRTSFAVVFAARSSLWLGDDHLLCVDFSGYSEKYKRFYFRDIQAITLYKTARRLTWNWALGTPAVICLGVLVAQLLISRGQITPGPVTAAMVLLAFVIPLILNNAFGPTTACQLRTAVQTEDLPSLNRLRQTRRILARLHTLIEAAQGRLTPDEIHTRAQQANLIEPNQPSAAPETRYVADDPNAPPRILS